jgi:hypothetical protein
MKPLTFRNGDDFFEMAIATEEDVSLPSNEDAYVTVSIRSMGFMGHNDLWAASAAMRAFCAELLALEHNLRGEARLESLSPANWT